MKVLIVGGAGFVGSNLAKMLLQEEPGAEIRIIDNLLSSERFNVPDDPRAHFIEGSIADDLIVDALEDEFDYIYHLSTYHGNQSSISNPLADHENKTLTSLKLFDKIKAFQKVKKIVYSGAGCAVAEKTFDEATATVESDLVSLNMDSPYSISKIIGEFYAKYYHKQYGTPIVRARFQNVFGPGEVLGAGKWRGTPATVWRNVVPTFIYQALKKMPLTVENQGIATRDFIFVEDICRGLIACAHHGTPCEAYNLATGAEIQIAELAETINRMTGNTTPVNYLPKREWDNSGRRYGCPQKAAEDLGFQAENRFEPSLEATIAWTDDNLFLIEQTMQKHRHYVEIP